MLDSEQELFYSVIMGSIFLLVLIVIIVLTSFLYYSRRRRHQLEILEFERALIGAQAEIHETTLKEISEEIHDNIGQTLSLAKFNLNTINVANTVKAKEQISTTLELVRKSLDDLRSLSKTLHTDAILSEGFLNGLMHEVTRINRIKPFVISCAVSGNVSTLDAKVELILFRMIQECLQNCIKHSGATMVTISVYYTEHQLTISIHDNGKGFDLKNQSSGVGIKNIYNRARFIQGEAEIISSYLNGTQVTIRVPIKLI